MIYKKGSYHYNLTNIDKSLMVDALSKIFKIIKIQLQIFKL